jgi:hypothetical protein
MKGGYLHKYKGILIIGFKKKATVVTHNGNHRSRAFKAQTELLR